jgi:hypothetical protein
MFPGQGDIIAKMKQVQHERGIAKEIFVFECTSTGKRKR